MRRLLGLLVLLGVGSACSVQMAYNNLDRLARWSVSDYVDLTEPQRAYFDGAVDELWFWHRRSHLPEYAGFLERVGPALMDGTTETEMQALADRVIGWAEEIEQRGLPVAAEILASLSDEQVSALAQALEARNQEIAEPERNASLEEARQGWRKEFAERFTRFSGRLTPVQEAYLDQRAADYRPELVLWAEYRRRWQEDLLALLGHRRDVDAFTRGFAELARHRALYYGPELAGIYESNIALVREVSVWLVNSLTERQQQRFLDRLDELAEDFRDLARDGTAPSEAPPCLVTC